MEQLNMFEAIEGQERNRKWEEMFRDWLTLPAEKLIPATSSERPGVLADLAHGYCKRWVRALHRFPPPELVGESSDPDTIDLDEINKMRAMMQGIDKHTRRKALGDGGGTDIPAKSE